jgi:hypothetical protein
MAAAGAVVEAMLTVEGIVAVQLHLASGDIGFPRGSARRSTASSPPWASPPLRLLLISATHPFNYYFPLSSSISFADLTRICSRWFPRVEIREKFSCLFFRDGETESAM